MNITVGQIINYVTVPQNSGKALNCGGPGNQVVVVSAKYYNTTSSFFSPCYVDVGTKLGNYCKSSNVCYIQASNTILTPAEGFPASCGNTPPVTGLVLVILYVCNKKPDSKSFYYDFPQFN